MIKKLILVSAVAVLLVGCATESHRVVANQSVLAAQTAPKYSGVKYAVSIGKFGNNSSFQNGTFSDGKDRLGNQAQVILETHLQQSGRFNMLNRTNLSELEQETGFNKAKQNIKGAGYVITGSITEFGRKEVGDKQLFGLLGRGKTQVAYAKVSLNVVDVNTAQTITSVQGAGEYELSQREVIGFGSTASYDATLNGKVLDLAIREAVDNLVNVVERGALVPTVQ